MARIPRIWLIATCLAVALAACDAGPRPPSSATGTASVSIPPIAPPPSTSGPADLTASTLSSLITPDVLSAHLAALADAAGDGGTRATGSPGFAASVEYVAGELEAAGYEVVHQAFEAGGVESMNLVADRTGTGGGVLVLGAHLDSVRAGPGMNDNASGVVALLAIAQALAALPAPPTTVRFAFWGAEEGGPFGSRAYVEGLGAAEIAAIRAYLNFDMLGSPNGVTFVYAEAGAAPGSDAVTNVVSGYFRQRGRPWDPIDLEGDSDHGPFTDAGVPTGGLFAGGIEPVTEEQAARFGAIAGEPADACSHAACDTLDNVDLARLALMTDAIAHVLVALASDAS